MTSALTLRSDFTTPALCTTRRLGIHSRAKRARRRHFIHYASASSPGADAVPIPASLPGELSTSEKQALRIRRYGVFLAMGMSYACYVGLRATFPFAAPTLGLGLSEVGVVSSAFPFTYGLSRLLTGALVDNGSPRDVLLGGLALAGLSVASMALAPVAAVPLAAIWSLHGLVQGVGAGASAKLLTAWFPPSERGFYWSLWATSANAGAFGAPLAVAYLATAFGAREALLVSGAFALCVAVIATPVLRDRPSDVGFNVSWETKSRTAEKGKEEKPVGFWTTLRNEVLGNRALWALAAANCCIYLVRSGLKNWLHFFLIATRDVSPATAAVRASVAELGGVVGTFGAGVISDVAGGRRVVVTIAYLLALSISLALLGFAPAGSKLVDAALIAVVGFAINGPQMMIGLIGAEVVEPRVLASAAGILGFLSYGGAIVAGYPLSAIVSTFGWTSFFSVLAVAAVLAAVTLMPFWKLRSGSGKDTNEGG